MPGLSSIYRSTGLYGRLLMTIYALLAIGACSSNSDNFPTAEIVVTASLGQINGATVTMTQVDGTALPGASSTIDSSGTAKINYNAGFTGPFFIAVTGNANASYYDEASQSTVPFPAGQTIRAVGTVPGDNIGVSILTELAAQVAADIGSGLTAANVDTINESVRAAFAPDIDSILTPPTLVNSNNMNSQALGTDSASRYALRLAALAGIASGTDAPALTILQQLSSDLIDGALDGIGADGQIVDLAYGTTGFAAAFANAIQVAATTLANADLSAIVSQAVVATNGNLLQSIADAGVTLPSTVLDKINNSGGSNSGGGLLGSGNFDLTISGNISTAGVATPFALTLNGVPAPTPGDPGAAIDIVGSTVTGLSGIADLQVTVVNNTASQLTYDVSLTAMQSGVTVSLDLRYDYVASGGNANPDTGSGGSGGGTTGGSGGSTDGANFCLIGEPTPASIPASFSASVLSLTFTAAQAGAPFVDGDQRDFLISSSGALFINDVLVAENPVLCGGNEREAIWKDNTADLTYALSDLSGGFNEINIGTTSGTFLGQFVAQSTAPAGPPAALTGLAGTYETIVVESCSGDTCPNVTGVGELITVTIGTDGTITFAEQVINTEAEGASFNDFTSGSIEPRLTVTNTGMATDEQLSLDTYVQGTSPVAFKLTKSVPCGSGCSSSKKIYTEVTGLPETVTGFFNRFIAAMPTTMKLVVDDADYNGRTTQLTNSSFGSSALCRPFEINAALNRSAVESRNFRAQFAWFSGNKGGGDYLRRMSRYSKDDTTGDEFLSYNGGQLVIRGDGTIDIEEGLPSTATGLITDVKDRSTNDAAEIATACADYKTVTVNVTSSVSGFVNLAIANTTSGDTLQTGGTMLTADGVSTASFVLVSGTSYEVKITSTSPASLSCSVTNATGTVAAADITDVTIACAAGS